ncbi:peptidylprolyl isomerase [Chloroflexota bacterium]
MSKKQVLLISKLLLVIVLFVIGCSGGTIASNGDTVKVDYTGMLSDGTVFDSSVGKQPLEFTLGSGQVIEGFDKAVTGMKVGESKTVTIPEDEAYGQYRDDLVTVMDRSQLPPGEPPQIGQRLLATSADGKSIIFTVTEVDEKTVTVDANHPLAGKDLTFELKLVDIRSE